jgi:hypothetical protein
MWLIWGLIGHQSHPEALIHHTISAARRIMFQSRTNMHPRRSGLANWAPQLPRRARFDWVDVPLGWF